MKTFSSTFNILIIGVVVALLVLAAAVFFFQHIKTLNHSTADLRAHVESSVGSEEEEKDLRVLLSETEEERGLIDHAFITEEGVAGFLEEIEHQGRNVGAIVEIKKVDVVNADQPLPQLSIGVSARGSWQSVSRFLLVLESVPYNIAIHDIILEQRVGEEGAVSWNMEAGVLADMKK